MLSALCSGLTLGMMSLGVSELERKVNIGDENAAKILRVRKHGSLLLCALLLSNTAVNSTISVFLGSVTSGILAGITSTMLIVIFGEIAPQALFSRHALQYGAKVVWIVRALMFVTYPIAKPTSIFIDWLFGKEIPTRWDKKEITEIIKTHEENSIDSDESRIIQGALNFSDKKAHDVLTPATVLFMLSSTEEVTVSVLMKIHEQAFSRIPVYDGTRDNIIGVLYAKSLIGYKTDGATKTVGDLCDRDGIMTYRDDTKLDLILNNLLKLKKHMSFVFDEYGNLKGVVTMEDIMEEIIDKEILDESDDISDLQAHAKEKMKARFTIHPSH
jgi:metal transporter CNNM